MAGLTPKQQAFCRAYLETGNASEAYRRAYNVEKLKPATIKRRAAKLMNHGTIKATIEEQQAELREKPGVTIDSVTEQPETNEALEPAKGNGDKAAETAMEGGAKAQPAHARRREPRIEVENTTATIDGETYPMKNWSSRGFLVTGYTGGHEVGTIVHVQFRVPFMGMTIHLGGGARIVRVDKAEGELAGSVVDKEDEWQIQIESS